MAVSIKPLGSVMGSIIRGLALALQSDGRILVGGQFSQVDLTQRFNLARLNTNGSVDLTFDPRQRTERTTLTQSSFNRMARLLLAAHLSATMGSFVAELRGCWRNGALDFSFDSGVGTGGNVFALALQHNGQIVLGGSFVQYAGINRTSIARVFSNGALDLGFNPVPDGRFNRLPLNRTIAFWLAAFSLDQWSRP